MSSLAEALVAAIILIGAFFLFVGSLGLAKLPDLMRRLHGPTKATTLGIGAMLIASMTYFAIEKGDPSAHELLITLFLILTAPVTAQMIAKAQILRDRSMRTLLPPTGRSAGWATLDPVPTEAESRQAVSGEQDL
jgi:multicomponent K+:H+ antiporter subunit G